MPGAIGGRTFIVPYIHYHSTNHPSPIRVKFINQITSLFPKLGLQRDDSLEYMQHGDVDIYGPEGSYSGYSVHCDKYSSNYDPRCLVIKDM